MSHFHNYRFHILTDMLSVVSLHFGVHAHRHPGSLYEIASQKWLTPWCDAHTPFTFAALMDARYQTDCITKLPFIVKTPGC